MRVEKFFGYASIFNNTDSVNDVVLPSAFKRFNIVKQDGKTKGIKLLLNHDSNLHIGWIEKVKVDSKGLFVQGCIDKKLQHSSIGDNAIKNGFVGLSIGYYANKFTKDSFLKKRYIHDITLDEISVVKNPANKKAVIQSFTYQTNLSLSP